MKSFDEKVYEILMRVPKGRITTYKDIADVMNSKAYRAIGTALKRNPKIITIACHRVVKSNGEVGNYVLGTNTKIELLKTEGIEINAGKIKNFQRYRYKF